MKPVKKDAIGKATPKKKITQKGKKGTKGSQERQSFVVRIRPPAVVLVPGGTTLFRAVLCDQDGKQAAAPKWTWNSTSPSVATVDMQGRVIALAVGMSDIKATDQKTNVFGIAKVTVIP